MSGNYNHNQPGGVWYLPRIKALSYSWAELSGFSGAMHASAEAGSLKNLVDRQSMPMIRAIPKSHDAAYMCGHAPYVASMSK